MVIEGNLVPEDCEPRSFPARPAVSASARDTDLAPCAPPPIGSVQLDAVTDAEELAVENGVRVREPTPFDPPLSPSEIWPSAIGDDTLRF